MQTYKVINDAELVRLGAAACGAQKKLAKVAGCSERLLSEVVNGKRGLPTAPVPGINRTPAQLIQAAIDANGNVPEVHRAAGRPPRIDARGVSIEVPTRVARRLRAKGVDVSAAVLAFVARSGRRKHPWAPAPAVSKPTTKRVGTRFRCHLTPEASAAMAAFLDGNVALREAFLRAVALETLRPTRARAAA